MNDRSQWHIEDTVAMVILILGVLIFFSFLSSPVPTLTNRTQNVRLWPEQIGAPTHEFDTLLAKIKSDLGQNNIEVSILVGPYFYYMYITARLYPVNRSFFYILIDDKFFSELSSEEKRALIAHECGHIDYVLNHTTTTLTTIPQVFDRQLITNDQIHADIFAAKYVHPKHLLSLLDKLYADYTQRREYLEKLSQSR